MEHPCFPSWFSTQTCPTCFRSFLICLLGSTLPAPIMSPHSPTTDGLPSALLIFQWPFTVLRRRMSPHPGLRCSWSLHLPSAPWAFPIIPPLVRGVSGSASQTYKCRVWTCLGHLWSHYAPTPTRQKRLSLQARSLQIVGPQLLQPNSDEHRV